eukprot:6220432-Prorocentrum_lima.AAC.1
MVCLQSSAPLLRTFLVAMTIVQNQLPAYASACGNNPCMVEEDVLKALNKLQNMYTSSTGTY